ncbi:MAG: glutaredoxin [Holosporaceae bacterium]
MSASFLIYTTQTCPYCDFAKALLKEKGLAFDENDLTNNFEERQALVAKAGGRTSVPQIFFKDQHIGGYDDLKVWLEENDV